MAAAAARPIGDEGLLARLNRLSLTRTFTPQSDVDWSAVTTDAEYESLYDGWSLLSGTGLDAGLDAAARATFVKYQQMNLMMFTGLLERHAIAALARLYDLDPSEPFTEYVGHFIKEEVYHHMMFTRAVNLIHSRMPGTKPLPTAAVDRALRWLFRGLNALPGRRLRCTATFTIFRFAEEVSIFAHQAAQAKIARKDSFINQVWAYHALDEARHLKFDDMILERNRLPRVLAWLPPAMAAVLGGGLSLLLNANEVWIGRQVGLPLSQWQLPRLMKTTKAAFKKRVFGLLSKIVFGAAPAGA